MDFMKTKKQDDQIKKPYDRKPNIQLPKLRHSDVPTEKMNFVTSEFKMNEYYSNFMRDHFVFDDLRNEQLQGKEITLKLK